MAKGRTIRVAAAVVAVAALGAPVPASAATLVVDNVESRGWAFGSESCSGGSTASGQLVSGPSTPPSGAGSFRLQTGANGFSMPALRHAALDGVRPDAITALGYRAWTQNAPLAPSIVLDIDLDADGDLDDRLTFEPRYQSGVAGIPDQGPVASNAWQPWDARAGGWWALLTPGFAPGGAGTLAAYALARPTARVLATAAGGLALAMGCEGFAWAGTTGFVDGLEVATAAASTTYDFERAFVDQHLGSGFVEEIRQTERKDDALPTGATSATASATRTNGTLEVQTSASELAPVGRDELPGTGGRVGAADALASARFLHEVRVNGPADFRVTFTLAIDQAATGTTFTVPDPSVHELRENQSVLTAVSTISFSPCALGAACTSETAALDDRVVAATFQPGVAPQVTFSRIVRATRQGKIVVDAGLIAGSHIRGEGTTSARARASAVLDVILVPA